MPQSDDCHYAGAQRELVELHGSNRNTFHGGREI